MNNHEPPRTLLSGGFNVFILETLSSLGGYHPIFNIFTCGNVLEFFGVYTKILGFLRWGGDSPNLP